MLNPDWHEPEIKQYLVPNLVALAAKDLGVTDARVRLATGGVDFAAITETKAFDSQRSANHQTRELGSGKPGLPALSVSPGGGYDIKRASDVGY